MSFSSPLGLAALLGATGIGAGAFGAHALKAQGVTPQMLEVWDTAAKYHLLHAVAMLAVPKTHPLAAKLMFVGTLLFSGSLYFMVLTGIKKLGIITPIGGTTLMFAWLSLAF